MNIDKKWIKVAISKNQGSKKMLECVPLEEGIIPDGIFINLSRQFYFLFRENIGKGIPADVIKGLDLSNLGPILVNLHFAIELALKSLVLLKTGKNDQRTHEIKKLLKLAAQFYPRLSEISSDATCMNIINALNKYFNRLRYGEVTIHLNLDITSEVPFENFLNTTDKILKILWHVFKNNSR